MLTSRDNSHESHACAPTPLPVAPRAVEAADHSVQRMCRLLGVSRSGYYDYLARREQPPTP